MVYLPHWSLKFMAVQSKFVVEDRSNRSGVRPDVYLKDLNWSKVIEQLPISIDQLEMVHSGDEDILKQGFVSRR